MGYGANDTSRKNAYYSIKFVLAESSRWLLHRRRDTKKINIPG